jgi:predicted XRE-type DNA-binding protein
MKRDLDDTSVTVGSGNVFADIGVTDPELALAKSQLASRIAFVIRARGWTQKRAAKEMGVDQPKVSAIVRGRLSNFTVDRLLHLLGRLGEAVEFRFRNGQTDGSNARESKRAARKTMAV